MSDPSAPQPTQEEIEAYYAELREAPMGEVLMQCIGMLAEVAQVKLGRRDARLAIDGMAALAKIGEGHLGEASEQLAAAVAQLQMAQVQLERQMAGEGGEPADEAAPTSAPPTGAPAAGQPAAGQPAAGQPAQKATDKLWIPGR
jgi:hypothetical protein